MVAAELARVVLGQGVAVALAVGGPHERGDDLEVPVVHVAGLRPEVGEADVDIQLEQLDAAWSLGHEKKVEAGSDGPGGRGAWPGKLRRPSRNLHWRARGSGPVTGRVAAPCATGLKQP